MFGPGSLALAPDTVEGRFLGGAFWGHPTQNHPFPLEPPLWNPMVWTVSSTWNPHVFLVTWIWGNPFMKLPPQKRRVWRRPVERRASLRGGRYSRGGGKVPKSQANDGYMIQVRLAPPPPPPNVMYPILTPSPPCGCGMWLFLWLKVPPVFFYQGNRFSHFKGHCQ